MNIIKSYHQQLVHPGSKRLYNTIKALDTRITQKLVEYITSVCKTCQENKSSNLKYGILKGTIKTSTPWHTITIDIVGPLEIDTNIKINILHIMDHASRFSEIVRLKRSTANEVVKELERIWLLKYPLPAVI